MPTLKFNQKVGVRLGAAAIFVFLAVPVTTQMDYVLLLLAAISLYLAYKEAI